MKRLNWIALALAIGLAMFLAGCNGGGDDDDDADDDDIDDDDDTQQPPDAPSDLKVTEVKKYQASLNWKDNSENEDGFIVERREGSKNWQQIADLPENATEYIDTTLDCETDYQYRVKAYNDVGESDYSNVADAATLSCWTIWTIDSDGDVGAYTSIALDSNGKVHISYRDIDNDDLKYTTNTSSTWATHTIDSGGDIGWFTSIAIDSNDKVHVSYNGCSDDNCNNLLLKYVTDTSGIWQTFTIDSDGWVGWWTSISIDSGDKVHISYFCGYPHRELKYAANSSGTGHPMWWIHRLGNGVDIHQ